MRQGMLPEHTLTDSVLFNISKNNKTTITSGIGNDFSLCEGLITSDGFGASVSIAFAKALNNFYCSLGNPMGVRLMMLLPTCVKASDIKAYMKEFDTLVKEHSLTILGGHSESSEDISSPKFYVTIMGTPSDFIPRKKKIAEGYSIVMAGYAAVLGTNILIENEKVYLSNRLPVMYLESAKQFFTDCSILKIANLLKENKDYVTDNICYMHDISAAGVYSALWQLGKWMDKGFLVENRSIPIRQESIEICEQFEINPYLIDGTGALLLVCKNGEKIAELIGKANIPASVIGAVTDKKEKLIRLGPSDIRTLSPVECDDMINLKKKE